MQVEDTEQGNEPTLLDQLVEQVSKEPDPKTAPVIDPDDRDAVEEAAAAQALADEEAKAAAPVKVVEEPVTVEGKVAQPEVKADKTPMIPKPRFDEVRADAAYWKGVADERGRALEAKAAPVVEAAPTPQQKLESIEARRDALAAQVDDGKLLMSDFVKEDRKLKAEEEVVRDTMRKPADTQAPKRGSDLYLEQKTAELETKHPYVEHLSPKALNFLTTMAVEELEAEGVKLPKGDLDGMDLLALRAKIGELSDRLGPGLTNKTLAPRPTPAAKPALSPAAKNLQTKLQAAQEAPPDLTAAGRGGAPMEYTDAQLNAMTQDEMDALPMATLEKILNRQQS